jgi:hypothetical protein
MRISAAECAVATEAYTSAATEYKNSAANYATLDNYTEANRLYILSAQVCANGNEMPRCGEMLMAGAAELARGGLTKEAGEAYETAVRIFVPDEFNKMAGHRRSTPPADEPVMQMVSSAFAPELVMKAVTFFLGAQPRDVASALYCMGAVTALRVDDGDATQSLFRALLSTTVLQLALGDIVAADKTYMEVHLQLTSYLRSDECKVAEDLITAIKNFDGEALDLAKKDRMVKYLDPKISELVMSLQVGGKAEGARQKKPAAAAARTPAEVQAATAGTGERIVVKDIVADMGDDIDIGLDDNDEAELASAFEEMNRLTEGLEGMAEGMGGDGEGDDDDDDVDDDEIDLR